MKNVLILCLIMSVFVEYGHTQTPQTKGNPDTKIANIEWRSIGPYRGGRSCAVTGVIGNTDLYYFGATGGGVWKTKNAGKTWENISDGFFGGSIGAIAVADSDPNVIYVGGGEQTVRGNVSYGYGMWKSENAGKTWKSIGLTKSRHISRIRIHPKNEDVAYAAVLGDLYKSSNERGVYKTIDGGKTWKQVLFANADAGAIDLCIDPSNSRILYASTWRVRRTPYDLSSGGEGSALWKSTDSGETWVNISKNKGLPDGTWGISGVAVSPLDGDRIWAIIENDKGGVYRSDDGGENWKKVNEDRSLRQRAWYYSRIYADTEDKDMVYVVNVRYHKSTDGGKTFKSHNAPHGDHHDLWINPQNSADMIIADDGGAQVSDDGGQSWSTYYNQPTAQFYRLTTDDHFPYRIYAAQQDNSTIRILHRSFNGVIDERHWEESAGGESAHIAVDPLNNDVVYGGSYGGLLTRLDHKTGIERAINVYPDDPMGHGAEDMKYRFQWNFPIFFSKHNPKKLYACSNQLHVTTTEGQQWETISPDLTRNEADKLKPSGGPITKDNTGVEYYCTIFAADESPLKEGLIWTGSDDGKVHVTKDGGKNWTDVTPKNAPQWLMYNSIEPDPYNEAGCYLAGTAYKLGDYSPYLYKTSDFGKTWTKIINGIDPEHFTRVLRVDPVNKNTLYAGTESGAYISYDDGKNWNSMQYNLPIVPITDLKVKNNNLIAATQGRSIWIIDDLNLIQQSRSAALTTDHLFAPKDAYRIDGGQSDPSLTAGSNHPSGAQIYYYLHDYSDKNDTISLQINDLDLNVVRTLSTHPDDKNDSLKVVSGANMYNWNLRYPDAKKFDEMILWWASLSGAKVVPGEYSVKLEKNGKLVGKESFEVLADPRLDLKQSDYVTRRDFINKINETVTSAHTTIEEIRKVKKEIKGITTKVENSKPINDKIFEIDSLLTDIETQLYQTKNKSNQDPLNYPIKLTNKLAHINALLQISDMPPTDQDQEVRDLLISEIVRLVNHAKAILTKDIGILNQMIREQNIDAISTDKP